MPVYLRTTPRNLNSIAALLAVLETDLPSRASDIRLAKHLDDIVEPGLVLYSFMTRELGRVVQELARLRHRFGDTFAAVAGGPQASGDPDQTLSLGFRWVVVGEAGPELSGFVGQWLAGTVPPPGIYRFSPVGPLDRYPPWAPSGRLFAPVEITRGCPFGCAFCQTPALFGRKPRHRSLAALRQAFSHAVATGHSFTRFVAPNAFAYGARDARHPDVPAIESLLVAARDCGFRKLYFGTFPSEVRPESVRADLLRVVRGLCDNHTIALGLQSGSNDVLERLRRGHSVEEGIRAVEAIAAAGFTPRVDFIFGLPGETDVHRARTRQVIGLLRDAYGALIHAHRFTPLPGTPWAHERPSRIDAPTLRLIDELKGSGGMTGVRPGDFDEMA